jgi:Nitroreductase
MFKELVKQNRSYRRFHGDKMIEKETLMDLVDIARITPSTKNQQCMRYRLVNESAENASVYTTLGWAGFFKDWNGPVESQRPTAYIVTLREKSVCTPLNFDDGIVAQTITLAAAEVGLGCCILQNCKWRELFSLLNIDEEKYAFSCVIAIGYPLEEVCLEEMKDDDVKYWRTEDEVHHVPKRKLEDIII